MSRIIYTSFRQIIYNKPAYSWPEGIGDDHWHWELYSAECRAIGACSVQCTLGKELLTYQITQHLNLTSVQFKIQFVYRMSQIPKHWYVN